MEQIDRAPKLGPAPRGPGVARPPRAPMRVGAQAEQIDSAPAPKPGVRPLRGSADGAGRGRPRALGAVYAAPGRSRAGPPPRRGAAALRALGLGLALLTAGGAAAETVVLDPGHGGVESGTQSASGVLEKTVVLKISRYAAQALQKRGVSVRLTRGGDEARSLPARPAAANRSRARVFVSVHANWAPVPSRRGLEVYVLSADASDAQAKALVRREGRLAGAGGPAAGAAGGDLAAILGELRLTQAHADSGRLARRLERSLSTLPGLQPARGLRQAPFAVLKGAKMPAVLVELGYLSNAEQAAYLASEAAQRAIGRRLADGILRFLGR